MLIRGNELTGKQPATIQITRHAHSSLPLATASHHIEAFTICVSRNYTPCSLNWS